MFSLHCFEGLEIKGCCGKRKRGDTDSDVVAAKPGVVVTVNTKTAANSNNNSGSEVASLPQMRRQAWAARQKHGSKRHVRRRRPGHNNDNDNGSHDSSLVHRRISAASGGSVVVREALAMVDACNNWMACLTQGNVDFALPGSPTSMFGTCIVSPQRQVMSLSGFDAYVVPHHAPHTHVNDVFQKNFASLLLSLVNTCFERKTASAIRLVHKRQPYNVVAYPLLVPPDIVEGVLLVYREDQVAPAEFSNLIVTATKL